MRAEWVAPLLAAIAFAAAPAAASVQPGLSVADILRVADFGGLSASPDGRSLVFRVERADVAANAYPTSWHAWSADQGLRSLGSGGDVIHADPGIPVHETPLWRPDGGAIFFRALAGGEIQLWRAVLDGSGSGAVVTADADIEALVPAQGGRSLIFTAGPSRATIRRSEIEEYESGILVDQHVDLAQGLFRGAIVNGRRATQRLTGTWFSRAGLLWRAPRNSRTLDLATLEVAEAPQIDEVSPPPSPGARARQGDAVSPDGDVALIRPAEEGGGIEVRRGNGARDFCQIDACGDRISWLSWGRSPDEMIFATQSVARAQSIFVWNLASGDVRLLVESDGLLSGGRERDMPCVVADEALFCAPASAGSPPRLERIDLDSGARQVVFDPNSELRNRLRLRVEHLRWRSSSGHEFTGTLLSAPPSAAGPRPLFITYYLCEGFLRGGLGDEWPLAALAEAGFDALCITSTILPGRQDALANNRAAADGIGAIVARLSRAGRTDPRRIGMGGLSFGSEVTLWMAFNSRVLAAASIASPGLEPSYYWFNGVRGRDHHRILEEVWGLRSPEETPARWRQLSAALNVDRIAAPLLMQLPEQEARLIAELHARLSNTSTPVELYAFPDEPHIKVQPRHKLAAYQRNLDWFRYWLLGERDPDPLRQAQYERWDALRTRRDVLNFIPRSAATARVSPGRRSESSEGRSAPQAGGGNSRPTPDR